MNKHLFPIALLATGLGATAFAFAQAVSQPTQSAQQPSQQRPAQPSQPTQAQPSRPSQSAQADLAVLPEFKEVDANENGMIEAAETETLAEQLKDEHQISFQFEAVDRNRDGMINTQEYVAYDAVLKERLGIA